MTPWNTGGLTPQQERVLAFIRTYIAKKGVSPSYREISQRFGQTGPTFGARHVRGLAKRGVLTVLRGKARSIRLVDPLDALVEQLLDNIVHEDASNGRVVVRAEDIAALDLAMAPRRRGRAA